MMSAPTSLPKSPAEEAIDRIFSFRRITRADQHLLMSALLSKNALSEKERQQINQVFDALQKGLLKVVE